MKKRALITVLILSTLLLLSSCFTLNTRRESFTEEEAKEAMHIVMTKAAKSATTRFFQKIASNSFFPQTYSVAEENKDTILGMKNIIDAWNRYVAEYLESYHEVFEIRINSYVEQVEFCDGMSLVNGTDTSGSEYLLKNAEDSFINFISDAVSKMDFSILTNAVNQYNAWVISENFKNKTNIEQLKVTDVSQELTKMIYNVFVKNLELFEELYRTTPDPYTEDLLIKVFGIK